MALSFLLIGCATAYGPKKSRGGYTDFQLGPDTFEVSFLGNEALGPSKTNQFFYRRCAEIVASKGFSHFTVSEGENERNDIKLKGNPFGSKVSWYKKTGIVRGFSADRAPAGAFETKTILNQFK